MTVLTNNYYSVDDEFGNQIATGIETYDAAVQVARRYLSAHPDAPCVEIHEPEQSLAHRREDILAR